MALYHTYRPQTFSEVAGQYPIVTSLKNQVIHNTVAHAYIFSGPRGVGKTTCARILAKAINCEQRKPEESDPCNVCTSCVEISGFRSIDVIEIDAASHTGVDNVRENIIDNAQFHPTRAKKKIFIIDEVHMLSMSAFNALLKTLEEPPAHIHFILATTELAKLPDTILSRCQQFNFQRIPYDQMITALNDIVKAEKVKIDREVIDRVVRKSDGCLRDAVSLIDQLLSSGEKHITEKQSLLILPTSDVSTVVSFLSAILNRNTSNALQHLSDCALSGVNFFAFASHVIELLRVMLLQQFNPNAETTAIDLSPSVHKELIELGKNITPMDIVHLLDLFIERRFEIKSAPIPQLPIELATVEWCVDGTLSKKTTETATSTTDSTTQGGRTTPEQKHDETPAHDQPVHEKKIKNTMMEKVKQMVHKQPDVSEEQVKQAWDQWMKRIESDSPSLSFIMKMAKIDSVIGHVVHVSVHHRFHKDKLTEPSTHNKVTSFLSEILEQPVEIDFLIADASASVDAPNKELQELASAFGGEVVT